MKRKLALTAAAIAITGMAASSALAAPGNDNGNNSRPGWGNGDAQHVHTGPPGDSVNPGHHHFFWWWIWNFLRHFHFPWS
jgi:hypothetical protein